LWNNKNKKEVHGIVSKIAYYGKKKKKKET
jgi:hypothetical protein